MVPLRCIHFTWWHDSPPCSTFKIDPTLRMRAIQTRSEFSHAGKKSSA